MKRYILIIILNIKQIKEFTIKSNSEFGLIIQNINSDYFHCEASKHQDNNHQINKSSLQNKRRNTQVIDLPDINNSNLNNNSNSSNEVVRRNILSIHKLRPTYNVSSNNSNEIISQSSQSNIRNCISNNDRTIDISNCNNKNLQDESLKREMYHDCQQLQESHINHKFKPDDNVDNLNSKNENYKEEIRKIIEKIKTFKSIDEVEILLKDKLSHYISKIII